MHRRQFLGTVGTAVGSVALTDPERVADLVRRRTASNVDDLTLEDMELTVDHLVQQVAVRPHHELYPLAARNWAAAERLLDGWQSLGHRRRLVELASQLAFYTGRLHFSAGRYPAAWQFATLTHRYAAETDDLVLRHSAALLQSSVAFYNGSHRRAVDLLERGDQHASRYTRARGRAFAARAHAALGDHEATSRSLHEMRVSLVDLSAQPGEIPFTASSALMFTAGSLTRLGDGSEATSVGRDAVAAFDMDPQCSKEEKSHAKVSLAIARALHAQPDPEEAADIGSRVSASPELLTDNVVQRLSELRSVLSPWNDIPQVAVLADQIAARERLCRA
jgi:hypothetical protein